MRRMTRRWLVALAVTSAMSLGAPGCSLERSGLGRLGCRATTECPAGSACVDGICIQTPTDASIDATTPDTGLPDGGPPDASADSGLDAGLDAGADSGFDAGVDGGRTPGPLLSYSAGAFSRASAATYFDPATGTLTHYAVDEPRLFPDGSIYLEGARTNWIGASERLDGWNAQSVSVTADVLRAPDGATTAERAVFQDEANASLFLVGGPWGGPSRPRAAISIFASGRGADQTLRQYWRSGGANQLGPDRTFTGTWTRLTESREDMERAGVWQASSAAARIVGLWGAQAEVGSFASQYIPATAALTTRAGDVLVFPSAPRGMREDRWTFEARPEASSAELVTGDESWVLFEFGGAGAVTLEARAGETFVSVELSGSTHLSSSALTFPAGRALEVTLDPARGELSILGADAGDGTSAGGAWTFPAGTLRVGSDAAASRPFFGRLSRPLGFP